ncbi:IS110 family transposase [Cereibacter sphaeroides]|uniref:IS110 family transposase n=1 Tax=Cereibacter sphaeroides TaxID=1063 RepID=UPI002D80F2E4|nr:transposase [Cereibacter sphaeroides]
MKLFVGLDASLEKTAICVTSVNEAQVASEPEALLHWVGDQDGAVAAVGLEAGPLSRWLHRGLSEAGQPVVLTETRQVKGALKAMPIKTDRRDAEGIARLLRRAPCQAATVMMHRGRSTWPRTGQLRLPVVVEASGPWWPLPGASALSCTNFGSMAPTSGLTFRSPVRSPVPVPREI